MCNCPKCNARPEFGREGWECGSAGRLDGTGPVFQTELCRYGETRLLLDQARAQITELRTQIATLTEGMRVRDAAALQLVAGLEWKDGEQQAYEYCTYQGCECGGGHKPTCPTVAYPVPPKE
jgi:hypothetical protein